MRVTLELFLLCYRHLSFLLHSMFDNLTATEQTDLAGVLRSYTSKCSGTALSIALDNGTILPPVPFTRFPQLRSVQLVSGSQLCTESCEPFALFWSVLCCSMSHCCSLLIVTLMLNSTLVSNAPTLKRYS